MKLLLSRSAFKPAWQMFCSLRQNAQGSLWAPYSLDGRNVWLIPIAILGFTLAVDFCGTSEWTSLVKIATWLFESTGNSGFGFGNPHSRVVGIFETVLSVRGARKKRPSDELFFRIVWVGLLVRKRSCLISSENWGDFGWSRTVIVGILFSVQFITRHSLDQILFLQRYPSGPFFVWF